MCNTSITSRGTESKTFMSSTGSGTTVVPVCCMFDTPSEILVNLEATDYRSNFAKTILFEENSCFSKIPFSISVESPRIF